MKYIEGNGDIRAVAIVQHNLDKPVLINLKREKKLSYANFSETEPLVGERK